MIAAPNPHPRASRNTERIDPEGGGCLDHALLELPHVPDHVAANSVQVQNRVSDNLARAVIGDIAAAIGVMKFDALTAEEIFGNAQVFALAIAAEGNDVGMFAKEQKVGYGGKLARGNQPLLQGGGFSVADEPEVNRLAVLSWREFLTDLFCHLSGSPRREAFARQALRYLWPSLAQKQRRLPWPPTTWDGHAP